MLVVQRAALDAIARRRAHRLDPHEAVARRFVTPAPSGAPWREQPPWERRAVSATTVVLCPGLLGALMPMAAFATTAPLLEREFGVRVIVADSHPAATCASNARDILRAVTRGEGFAVDGTELRPGAVTPGDVVLVGYSKGTPDALTMIAEHPEVVGRVRAVVSWAGAAGGSYLADTAAPLLADLDVDDFLTGAGGRVLRRFIPATHLDRITRREDEFDVPGAIGDLRTGVRGRFLDEHRALLDDLRVPFLSVAGAVGVRDVPYFRATQRHAGHRVAHPGAGRGVGAPGNAPRPSLGDGLRRLPRAAQDAQQASEPSASANRGPRSDACAACGDRPDPLTAPRAGV